MCIFKKAQSVSDNIMLHGLPNIIIVLSATPQSTTASSTTTEIALFTEQLWNKTEGLLIHDSKSCSQKTLSKDLEMDSVTQETNRNVAEAIDKIKQDFQREHKWDSSESGAHTTTCIV